MRLRGAGNEKGRGPKPQRGTVGLSRRAARRGHKHGLSRAQRFRQSPARFIPPNIVTGLGVASGVAASTVAYSGGDLRLAGWLMVAAAIFDGGDGKVARLCHAKSKFGERADSFADFIAYGITPAFMVHALGQRTDVPEVISALVGTGVVATVGYRLWRYMEGSDDAAQSQNVVAVGAVEAGTSAESVVPDLTVAEGPDFYGLPSTAGGPLIAGAVMAADTYADGSPSKAIAAISLAALVSGLMVSKEPYRHLKNILTQPSWGLRWYGRHVETAKSYAKLGIFSALTTASVMVLGPGLTMMMLWGGYAALGRDRRDYPPLQT